MRLLLVVLTSVLVIAGCGGTNDAYMNQGTFLAKAQELESRQSQLEDTIEYACSYRVTDNVRDKTAKALAILDEVDAIDREQNLNLSYDWGFDELPEADWQHFAHLGPDFIKAMEDVLDAITDALRDQGCNV